MSRPSALDLNDSGLSSLSKEGAISAVRELCSYIRQLELATGESATATTTATTTTTATATATTTTTAVSQDQQQIEPASGSSNAPVQTSNSGSSSMSEERLRQQQQEASRRENVLVMRLTTKEQEVQEYLNKLEEMRMNAASTSRTVRLDPAVNLMFQRMKLELKQARDEVDQTRQELNAWKFTPDSNTGKRLMARCRTLIQENEELGKLCSSGRVGKLEGDVALLRTHCEELRKTQAEMDDFLLELDDDMEGLQSTILFLQGELKKMHEENVRLRTLMGLGLNGTLDEELAKKQPITSVSVREDSPGVKERIKEEREENWENGQRGEADEEDEVKERESKEEEQCPTPTKGTTEPTENEEVMDEQLAGDLPMGDKMEEDEVVVGVEEDEHDEELLPGHLGELEEGKEENEAGQQEGADSGRRESSDQYEVLDSGGEDEAHAPSPKRWKGETSEDGFQSLADDPEPNRDPPLMEDEPENNEG